MKAISYDLRAANRLIPLLRSIVHEHRERCWRIARLEHRLQAIARGDDPIDAAADAARTELVAETAEQKREVRSALRELAELGCALETAPELLVRIPGEDGRLETGYCWRPGEAEALAAAPALDLTA